jgi:superfamily I DNA/RNA helicase/RecB family exonuclease
MPARSQPHPEHRIGPDDWPAHIEHTDGPQLVVGGPGTGKTEFLVRRAGTIIDSGRADPENLLVLSFSRRGVADVADRLRDRLDRSTRSLDITTYHSFALRLLEAHATSAGWEQTPAVLTSPEQVRFVATLLATEDEALWSPVHRSLLDSFTFAGEVTDFILRCREQLLGPSQLAALDRADWRGLPGFMERYEAALRRDGRIDYGTLLATAVDLLSDEGVRAAVAGQFDYVLVDEYQDTSRAQARLLRNLVIDHGNITVAADPYQSIYSFRGTDLQNVSRFPDEFPDQRGNAATRLVLTTSFRVPEAILSAAVRVTQHDLPGAAGPVVAAPGPGSVETYRFEQQTEEAEWIAAEITRLHLEQGIPYYRIAVFVRSKRRFLPELSRALDRRRIPHERPDARLVDQPAVRFALDCVMAATGSEGPAGRDRAVRRLLLGPLFRLPPGQLRNLERANPAASRDWTTVIRTSVPDGGPIAALLEDPEWAVRRPALTGLWHVWSSLPQLRRVATDEARNEERSAWTSLFQVVERFNERNPHATLEEYCGLMSDDSFEARPLLSYRPRVADSVTITTLHQSKGLHFDIVFIADAVEGVFPDLRTRDSLLGARHLNPHLPTDVAGYVLFRLQEERRLAYTAMTRAARRVIWTATTAGGDRGVGAPSRFLALVAGTASVEAAVSHPGYERPPVTVAEMEAFLRRLLLNPAAPSPDRVAALAVLAESERLGLRPPEAFYGTRRKGSDDGVIEGGFTLSPTQAEAYERCPRRYVLERRLGIGAESSIYADFGSLIHAVLETVERAAMKHGRPRATCEEALDELDVQFSEERFGGQPFAESWRRRGRAALERLYGAWPSPGTPIALERDLLARTDDIEWRGRADRIELHDGSVKVVDYKTSRTIPSEADAAESLQLGFYLLAAGTDPEITTHGVPRAGEMWFPVANRRTTAVRAFDGENLPEIESRMRAVARGISKERWPATANDGCDRCPVRLVCPAQPEGKEAFAS